MREDVVFRKKGTKTYTEQDVKVKSSKENKKIYKLCRQVLNSAKTNS